MAFSIERRATGFFVAQDGQVAAGPFHHRGEASDWIVRKGQETHSVSLPEIIEAIKAAMADGPIAAPRGRPTMDHSRETTLAFEYYWRIRQRRAGKRPASQRSIIAVLAKEYDCTPDHVRKVRKEYSPVAGYDLDSLTQLRAQAIAQLTRPAVLTPSPPPSMKRANNAEHWLRQLLTSGPMLRSEIDQRGRVAGFKTRTIERAKCSLGITSLRIDRAWAWKLPSRAPKG